MKKRKLNYRIHNPNTVEATADYLLKILMETNSEKMEKAIRTAAETKENLNVSGGSSCIPTLHRI